MAVKIKIVSDGIRTYAEIGGKCIGSGIKEICFRHSVNGESELQEVTLDLKIDLSKFEFLPDGKVTEAEKWMRETPADEVSLVEKLSSFTDSMH